MNPSVQAASQRPWWLGSRPLAPQPISLALQGGGAHGAFTWGVLDVLLQEPDIAFDGLSGSSAGAMNAVVMAHGWAVGGRDGARQALDTFWRTIGEQLPAGLVQQTLDEHYSLAPASQWLMKMAGLFAPAQLNPLDVNPLRDILQSQIDFERLRRHSPMRLFVGATHVNTGKLRLFREHELNAQMLLASACLPTLHHTVMVDGEPYWDGGFAANPALYPLVQQGRSRDLLMVLLTPLAHARTPQTRNEIDARIAELAFSTHFIRELQALLRLQALATQAWWPGKEARQLARTCLHMIDVDEISALQRHDSKLLAYGPFLAQLKELGEEAARQWLSTHRRHLGQRSTLDARRWLA